MRAFFLPVPTTASEWIVRMNAGPLSWRDRRAFARWISENPARHRDMDEARTAWRMAGRLATSQIAHDYLARSLRASTPAPWRIHFITRPRIAARLGIAFAACTLLAIVLFPDGSSQVRRLGESDNVRTAIGKIERYVLPDNSSLTVAANSVVHITFTDLEREMSLDQGEAFFEVTRDADRPFVVKAGTHEVMVTGTKFNVDYNSTEDGLEVAVAEGAVNVTVPNSGAGAAVERVKAGEVIFFPTAGPPVRRNLTPAQASAWRSRMLYFDETRLSDVVVEMNRYAAKPLSIVDDDISRLRLTGQFEVGDTRALLFVLHEIFGIEARETTNQWELFKIPET